VIGITYRPQCDGDPPILVKWSATWKVSWASQRCSRASEYLDVWSGYRKRAQLQAMTKRRIPHKLLSKHANKCVSAVSLRRQRANNTGIDVQIDGAGHMKIRRRADEGANVTICSRTRDTPTVPRRAKRILHRDAKCGTNCVMNLRHDDSTVYDNGQPPPTEAPTETGQTAHKRGLAYRCLGIDPRDVQCVPFLANQLRRIARTVRGAGAEDSSVAPIRPLEYLRNSEDPDAGKVYSAYLSVPPSYRRLLPAEAFCLAAGVSPWRVLEILTVVVVRQGVQSSAIIASILGPRVVAKTVERALQNDGRRERMILLRATGFLTSGR